MKIQVMFEIDADVEGWARTTGVTVEEAAKDIFEFLGRIDPVDGQTFLTKERAEVVES
jgi:hypothetical protein